uniref:Hexose transporter 1 n=1 Tax=Globisporangium ultimum (strain ATCC 200006 / CBS 805.95 / DAOM BR144) TaxID=431595 RepID=K3WG21_GLOUD
MDSTAAAREMMTERLLPADDPQQHSWLRDVPMDSSSNTKVASLRTTRDGSHGRLQLAAILVSLSSFLWGYGVAVLNVCIVPDAVGSLLIDINLSTSEQETATALVVVGALVSAVLTGGIGERIGQKKTILANNVFYIVGGIVCALATTKKAIFLGRFCIGIGSGIVTNTVPILLNEISPAQIRGQITSYHQLSLTIGMLATGILGYFLITEVPSGWRYLNAFVAVPAVLQCAAMKVIPESPWWLMKNKGREESKAALVFLRNKHDHAGIDAELRQISTAMEHRRHDKDVSWADLWTYKKVMVVGTFLVFFQAMTGINTVMLYSAKIFHFAGISNPFLATAVVGFTNVGVTIVSISFVDSYGRRPLLTFGTVMMILALLVLSTSLLYLNDNVHAQGIIAVIAVLLFVAGFAIGLGAVVWVILADMTPVHIRSRAFSFFMGISYICNIVVAVFTLSAISFLGRGPTPEKNGIAKLYLILSGVALMSLMFSHAYAPETKHTTDDSISKVLPEEHYGLLTEDDDDANLEARREVTEL